MNSNDGFEIIETMMSVVVFKLDFHYIKVETTYKTCIINAMLVPTDFRFKLKFVILFLLNSYNTLKA